jgi:hypothetical protein
MVKSVTMQTPGKATQLPENASFAISFKIRQGAGKIPAQHLIERFALVQFFRHAERTGLDTQ